MELTQRWSFVILSFSCLILMTPISGYINAPSFHETEPNVTVHSGELAILRCTIENLGPKTVSWRKLGPNYLLTIGDMVYMSSHKIDIQHKRDWKGLNHWNLIIKRVAPDDAGLYECQVSSAQQLVYYVQLNVLDSPPEPSAGTIHYISGAFLVMTANTGLTLEGRNIVNFNEPINLTCLVRGENRAPEDVDWFFNGIKIVSGSSRWRNRVYITRERETYKKEFKSQLLIDNSNFSDTGVFVCRASADLVKSIAVSVLEAPSSKPKKNRDVTGNKIHGKFISDEKNSSKMLHGFSLQLTFIIQLIIQTWSRWQK